MTPALAPLLRSPKFCFLALARKTSTAAPTLARCFRHRRRSQVLPKPGALPGELHLEIFGCYYYFYLRMVGFYHKIADKSRLVDGFTITQKQRELFFSDSGVEHV